MLKLTSSVLFRSNVDRVCNFMYVKLQSPAVQWRRVLKSLTAIEFIIKNGSPPAVIQFKRDMYKISALCNFTYNENGMERGNSVREKVNLIIDMLSQENRLYQERAEAFEYRKKFYPGAGPTSEQAGVSNPAAVFQSAFTGGVYSGQSHISSVGGG